jgi:hypothetical protein
MSFNINILVPLKAKYLLCLHNLKIIIHYKFVLVQENCSYVAFRYRLCMRLIEMFEFKLLKYLENYSFCMRLHCHEHVILSTN